MYKVADNVYGESECYSHGDEVRVETRLYYLDDNGDEHPVTEIYDLDAEPIDDYDAMNAVKFAKFADEMFSITAKAKIPIAFIIGIKATAQLQNEFDRKHRL